MSIGEYLLPLQAYSLHHSPQRLCSEQHFLVAILSFMTLVCGGRDNLMLFTEAGFKHNLNSCLPLCHKCDKSPFDKQPSNSLCLGSCILGLQQYVFSWCWLVGQGLFCSTVAQVLEGDLFCNNISKQICGSKLKLRFFDRASTRPFWSC